VTALPGPHPQGPARAFGWCGCTEAVICPEHAPKASAHRWSIWYVRRDGHMHDAATSNDPAMALRYAKAIAKHQPGAVVGITDNEDPELGDVTERLEQGL